MNTFLAELWQAEIIKQNNKVANIRARPGFSLKQKNSVTKQTSGKWGLTILQLANLQILFQIFKIWKENLVEKINVTIR